VTGASGIQPTRDAILNALSAFVGTIEQVPPNYSAIQVNGVRSYDRARAGEDFKLASRTVRIHDLTYNGPIDAATHSFTVVCETGTYVRSLARDMATQLGTLGYVSYLRRTCDGPFDEQAAIPLANLLELGYDHVSLLPLSSGLDDILAVTVRDEDIKRLYNGGPIAVSNLADCPDELTEQQTVRIYYKEHLCGMGVCEDRYKPVLVQDDEQAIDGRAAQCTLSYTRGEDPEGQRTQRLKSDWLIQPKRILNIGLNDVDYN
jgi:tRNA U55 pseudouridine synthase TruB